MSESLFWNIIRTYVFTAFHFLTNSEFHLFNYSFSFYDILCVILIGGVTCAILSVIFND